jgi:hypothetical protein
MEVRYRLAAGRDAEGHSEQEQEYDTGQVQEQTADVQRLHLFFAFADRFLTKSRIRFDRAAAGTSAHTARPPAPENARRLQSLAPFALTLR